jgi:DNA-binding PadR family transcriptional regulator
MARSSQTHLAVLGALSVEPMTGYAVRAAITQTLGHFWSESFGQIYPTLTELSARGEIRPTEPGRTSGSRFELTAAGRTRLRELLAEPAAVSPPRNGLLLRLFLGGQLGSAHCRVLVQESADLASAMLAGYATIRTETEAEIAAARAADDDRGSRGGGIPAAHALSRGVCRARPPRLGRRNPGNARDPPRARRNPLSFPRTAAYRLRYTKKGGGQVVSSYRTREVAAR